MRIRLRQKLVHAAVQIAQFRLHLFDIVRLDVRRLLHRVDRLGDAANFLLRLGKPVAHFPNHDFTLVLGVGLVQHLGKRLNLARKLVQAFIQLVHFLMRYSRLLLAWAGMVAGLRLRMGRFKLRRIGLLLNSRLRCPDLRLGLLICLHLRCGHGWRPHLLVWHLLRRVMPGEALQIVRATGGGLLGMLRVTVLRIGVLGIAAGGRSLCMSDGGLSCGSMSYRGINGRCSMRIWCRRTLMRGRGLLLEGRLLRRIMRLLGRIVGRLLDHSLKSSPGCSLWLRALFAHQVIKLRPYPAHSKCRRFLLVRPASTGWHISDANRFAGDSANLQVNNSQNRVNKALTLVKPMMLAGRGCHAGTPDMATLPEPSTAFEMCPHAAPEALRFHTVSQGVLEVQVTKRNTTYQ